jgi:hypothetical protein
MPFSNEWALRKILVERQRLADNKSPSVEEEADALRQTQRENREAARREVGKLVDRAKQVREEAQRHHKK